MKSCSCTVLFSSITSDWEMKCHQRGFYLTLGGLNVLAVILMSVAVGTNRWTEANVIRKIVIAMQNSTSDASFDAGFKYIGLFRGCEEKKYAVYFEPRLRCFTGTLHLVNFLLTT